MADVAIASIAAPSSKKSPADTQISRRYKGVKQINEIKRLALQL